METKRSHIQNPKEKAEISWTHNEYGELGKKFHFQPTINNNQIDFVNIFPIWYLLAGRGLQKMHVSSEGVY